MTSSLARIYFLSISSESSSKIHTVVGFLATGICILSEKVLISSVFLPVERERERKGSIIMKI